MTQVFISHSNKDLAFVKRLAKDLKAFGLEVWYDVSGLDPGVIWVSEIKKAIRESQFFMVVLTPNSVKSKWVERELLFAEKQKLKIIPLVYIPCELPMWSLNLQCIDIKGRNYRKHFPELLKVMGIQSGEKLSLTKEENPNERIASLKELIQLLRKIKINPVWILAPLVLIALITFVILGLPQLAARSESTPTQVQGIENPVPLTTNTPIQSLTVAPVLLTTQPTLPPPVITGPKDGGQVTWEIDVFGSGAQPTLEPGTYLDVIVIAPSGGLPTYYVQKIPDIQADGTWRSSPVFIGTEGLPSSGKTFQICAVLHDQQLQPGELPSFPTGSKSCIKVIRE